jgi:acyl-CoA thioesterase
MNDDAQQQAETAVRALYAPDQASRLLGIEIDAIAPGAVTVSMTVKDFMVNGFGICHGGLLFALADSAFAFSCNSCGERTVAASGQIDFLEAVHVGERLSAAGRRVWERGRQGIYEVAVTRDDGQAVALFRGRSHRTRERR